MRTALALILTLTTACSVHHRVARMNHGADLEGAPPRSKAAPPPKPAPKPVQPATRDFVAAPAPAEFTPSSSPLLD